MKVKKNVVILFDQSNEQIKKALTNNDINVDETLFVRMISHGEKTESAEVLDSDVINIEISNKCPNEKFQDFYSRDLFRLDVFDAFQNTIHINSVRHIYNMLYTLEEFLNSNSFEKVLLIGGNRNVEFFPVFYAEGEVPFKLLYKKFWSKNYYIKKFFKKTDVNILNETSSFFLKCIKLYRRFVLVLPKLFYYLVLKIAFFRERSISTSSSENVILLSLRSTSQIQTISTIIEKLPEGYKKIVLANDLIQSPGISKCKIKGAQVVSLYPSISLLSVFNVLAKVIKVLIFQKDSDVQELISSKEIWKEIYSTYDEYECKRHALLKIMKSIKGNVQAFISTETYGQTAIMEKQLCETNSIQYINVQNVIYEYDWIPKFPIADKTFLFSTEVEFFNKSEDIHFETIGPVWLDRYYGDSIRFNENKIISIFTQPDSYSKFYIELIRYIVHKKESFKNHTFCIKPHPREKKSNIEVFNKLVEENPYFLTLASKKTTSLEMLERSFATISVSSTVLYESTLIGVPAIGFNPKGEHQDYSNEYDHLKERYIFHIHEPEDLLVRLDTIENDMSLFIGKRETAYRELVPGYKGSAVGRIVKSCNL